MELSFTLTGKLRGTKRPDGSYGCFGLYMGTRDRKRHFCPLKARLDSDGIDIELPGVHLFHKKVPEAFWGDCPGFTDHRIGDWMRRCGDRAEHGRPWPEPPKYIGELDDSGERVTLTVRAERVNEGHLSVSR